MTRLLSFILRHRLAAAGQRFALFAMFMYASATTFAQSIIETRLPSEVAGSEGIFIRLNIPSRARYEAGAPVVIHLAGGFGSNGLGVANAPWSFRNPFQLSWRRQRCDPQWRRL
jgi:hypothetical protein